MNHRKGVRVYECVKGMKERIGKKGNFIGNKGGKRDKYIKRGGAKNESKQKKHREQKKIASRVALHYLILQH